MAKRREKPGIIVRKTPRGLSPVSAFDAEQLIQASMGKEFDLVPRSRRSLPQQRTYWAALKLVVDATERWATPEHLHRILKRACGFVSVFHDFDGNEIVESDSTSFDAMTQEEFQIYFDKAMAVLASQVGFDPLAFLEAA